MMGSPFIDKELRLREGTYPKLGNSWGSLPVRPVDSCHVHPLPCLSQEDEGVGSHSVLRRSEYFHSRPELAMQPAPSPLNRPSGLWSHDGR